VLSPMEPCSLVCPQWMPQAPAAGVLKVLTLHIGKRCTSRWLPLKSRLHPVTEDPSTSIYITAAGNTWGGSLQFCWESTLSAWMKSEYTRWKYENDRENHTASKSTTASALTKSLPIIALLRKPTYSYTLFLWIHYFPYSVLSDWIIFQKL